MISYGSWNIRCERQIFVVLDYFLSFQIPGNPENHNFKTEKNTSRYYHFTNVYHKWQSYDVWFLRYGVQQTEFFVILNCYFLFYPLNNPKNQNFEKIKKSPGDITILHIRTINDSHMMYSSWDMKHDGQNFLSFWTIFCTFSPLKNEKSKFWKNEKNTWRYHFTQLYQKSRPYAILFLRYDAWQMQLLFFILGYFWPFYPPPPPLTPQKIKISEKAKKMPRDIIILQMCAKNYD